MKEDKMVENSPKTGTERTENEKGMLIPYIAYEAAQSRLERIIKRLWITTIILIVLLVGSNVIWIVYENSFEDIVVTQESENESGDIIMNGTGELTIDGQSKTNG